MKKKWLSLLLAMTMVLSLVTPAAFAAEEKPPVAPYTVPANVAGKVVILHTNDTHGADIAVEGKSIGMAGVAQMKKEFEAAGAKVLLLSAGDSIMGKPLVSADQGKSAFEFMNAAGYDAMTVGNHELDFGIENLKELAAMAQFTILCADMTTEADGQTVFNANKVFDLDGVKVGVFGLATPETRTKADASKMPGILFPEKEGLYAVAQAQVDELKAAGADMIVCLGHLGIADESQGNQSIDVARNVTGIDLFIDGHSHSTTADIVKAIGEETNVVNGTKIVSTGTALANVGVVIYDAAAKSLTDSLVSAAEYTKVDEAVAALVDARNEAVKLQYGVKIAETEVDLNGSRSGGKATSVNGAVEVAFPNGVGNRTAETNLGDFAADAILWQARKVLGDENVSAALTNGGGIRETLAKGDISKLDLLAVFPFGNTVATIDVTGAQLLEALEAATCTTPDAIGAFPQVADIDFTVDTATVYENGEQYSGSTYYAPADPGSRVTIATVGGETWSAEATYTIATNDFTAKGGDTFGVFKTVGGYKDIGVTLEDALINYTTEALNGTITAEQYGAPAGRITVKYIGVVPGSWYADAAKYVMDEGLMSSTGNGFDPSATVNRATVFQTLYNAEGKPANEKAASFTDVDGKWYADAAAWAEANGIATVGDDALFNGDRSITRGEIAAILARYAEHKNLDTTAGGMAIREMADYDTLPDWAAEGMTLCFENGILSGKPGNLLAAGDTAIRAELAAMLKNFSALKEKPKYTFDPTKPYDAVFTGLYNDIPVTVGEDTGSATYYLAEGLQPYASVVIVLTPDNTTAAAFAETETGLAWRAVGDKDKIAVVFLGPDEGKTWNLSLDKNGRDDAAMLNQLYVTVRSRSLSNVAPVGVNRGHIALAGYEAGGAAALLFGTRYATNYSGIAAVDAPAISTESLKAVGEGIVLPFTGDGSSDGSDLKIQAKTVDMPVWFVNSDKDNKAAVDYFVAANDAKKAKANDYAETVYEAKDSDALIWISAKEQTPETIYDQFLGNVKRLRGVAPGRVSFTNDYSRKGFSIHEEEVNGELRRWITYVPTTYTGKKDVPLVLVMHGYGASMYGIAEESRWYDLAEENGFIAVFAQGLVRPADAMGNIPSPIWLAGAFGGLAQGVDPKVDVNFLNTLLDKMEAEYKIDTGRVYATGHSNGSMMTWEMGVQATGRFTAIAPIGYMTAPAVEFASNALLPTWAMVGEYDNAATNEMVEGNATVTALQAWNAHNGVDETKITESKQHDGGFETITFANAEGVPLVRFTTVMKAPHVYCQETSVTVWDEFFSKFSRGEDGKLFYEGKEVKADDYVASADWYTAAEK